MLLSQISSLLCRGIHRGRKGALKAHRMYGFKLSIGLFLALLGGACGEGSLERDMSALRSNDKPDAQLDSELDSERLNPSTPQPDSLVSSLTKEGQKEPSGEPSGDAKNELDPPPAASQAKASEKEASEKEASEPAEPLEAMEERSQAIVAQGGARAPEALEAPKAPKRCRRGIHKGAKACHVKRFHINIRQLNRGIKHKDLRLIGDDRNITKEGRKTMLELLGDWRSKERCGYGYAFNFEYTGRASWRMYDCYVQDRLLWYLYLIGHHFDSEIQVLSGLRANERKSSRHHNGHAVDFRVAGVAPKEVWEYCKKTFPLVGIGYYPKGKFIHLDVGRDSHQAYWVDSSGSGESAQYKRGVSQIQKGRARKSQTGMIKSIKGMLNRHYQAFKQQQAAWLKRKQARAQRTKRRRSKQQTRTKSLKNNKK